MGVGLSPRCGIVDCRRLGRVEKNTTDKIRPLRLTFTDIQIKRDVLCSGVKLRKSTNLTAQKIYISPDLTPVQRESERKLRDEMWARREQGERVTIHKGKIVATTKDIKMHRSRTPARQNISNPPRIPDNKSVNTQKSAQPNNTNKDNQNTEKQSTK